MLSASLMKLVAMLKRAGATGAKTVRADSGFWSWKLIDRLDAHDVKWSITVALQPAVRATIEQIPDAHWQDIDYTTGGQAQVAETTYVTGKGHRQRRVRLVVRRTRLTEPAQRRLWPDWRHHAFITNRDDLDTVEADHFHRQHAVIELAIRDLKEGTGRPTHPLRALPRQCRMAGLRRAGPQPRPLGHHPRRPATGDEPDTTHPPHCPPRRARQPIRQTHPAVPRPLALDPTLRPDAQRAPAVASTLRLNNRPRT